MTKPLFDLEQQILDCWKITDDLNLACEMANKVNLEDIVSSLAVTYNMRFEKMWQTFEAVCAEHYKSQKAAAIPNPAAETEFVKIDLRGCDSNCCQKSEREVLY